MDKKVFYVLSVVMLLVWGSLLGFFYLKADEVTKDPCSICSEYMGTQVVCTIGGIIPVSRTYYPNGSIVEPGVDVVYGGSILKIDESIFENITIVGNGSGKAEIERVLEENALPQSEAHDRLMEDILNGS